MISIQHSLEKFLASRGGERFDPDDYLEAVDLLVSSLNSYGYASLFHEEEIERFETAGDDEGAFCRIFGPEKIVDHYYAFLYSYLIAKCAGLGDLRSRVASIMVELAAWLGEQGHVEQRLASDAVEIAERAVEELPRAQRLGDLLSATMKESAPIGVELLDENDIYENYAAITRIENGKLWFDQRGPVEVGEEAGELAVVGWEVNIVIGRCPDGWRLLELGFVYPR